MPRKQREAKVDSEAGKTKELKIITVQVVTKDKVLSNPRQMALLYIIDKFGPIYEKTLQHIVYELQQKGAPLEYKFKTIAGTPYSPEFKSDLVALSYVGFIEFTPSKRIRITSEGKDALEKKGAPSGVVNVVESNLDELRNTASLMDYKLEESMRRLRELRGQQRRRLPGLGI